ncbi:MAG: integrase arm-type DNA-binding domain-containing protein, partial [Desulfobulbus sp.]|nr:integrase arm-type DNA-binding domain-containing protein [Desulfobulbus sp.]
MPLTETAIKNLKPGEKLYRVADEKGLCLEVTPSGGKLWRLKYRFGGKQKLLALGKYPEITLREARDRRDEARKLLAHGVDPSEERKAEKAAEKEQQVNTFGRIAEEWLETWREGKSERHVDDIVARMKHYVLPALADLPVAAIGASDILPVLETIQSKGILDTVQRVKSIISQVLQHAIGTGRRELADPCPYFNKVLKTHVKKHQPAFTKPEDVQRLLKAIDSHVANPKTSVFVSAALKLLPLLFCRPGELIAMQWSDVDLERAEWRYMASKTKTEHLVPLARQPVEILLKLQVNFGTDNFVFPGRSRRGFHISNMTVNRALQTMGYDTKTEITGHGFRAMARTMLAERLG